jgi:hypothetical protein
VSSVIGGTFLVIRYTNIKSGPARTMQLIPLYLCTISVFMSFVILLSLAPHADEPIGLFCTNEVAVNRQKDGGMCLFQSIVFCYGTVVASCWWLCSTYDVYQRVIAHNESGSMTKYHLFSWLTPCIGVVILLSLNRAGYGGSLPFCFSELSEDLHFYWLVIIAPIGATLVPGTFFMFQIIKRVIDVYYSDDTSAMKALGMVIRPFLFLVLYDSGILFTVRFLCVLAVRCSFHFFTCSFLKLYVCF